MIWFDTIVKASEKGPINQQFEIIAFPLGMDGSDSLMNAAHSKGSSSYHIIKLLLELLLGKKRFNQFWPVLGY